MPSAALPALPQDSPRPPHGEIGPALLRQMLASHIILAEEWEALSTEDRERFAKTADLQVLIDALCERQLLTEYQAARARTGRLFGLVLGNYRIRDRLGTGGTGVVYRAEHIRLRRPVALKVIAGLNDPDGRSLERFHAEMRAASQLRHPNLVVPIDSGDAPGPDPAGPPVHYYVADYIPGTNLERLVAQHGPLPIPRATELVTQLADALAEAHRYRLIHRDIKPANVLVTPDGQAKLLDLGLPRASGSVSYMAPEQAIDPRSADSRTDVYSLGTTLFWCLTGRDPFPSSNTLAQVAARQGIKPPSIRASRPELPAELDAVIWRMMAPKPEERYQSMPSILRALVSFVQPNSSAVPKISASEISGSMIRPNDASGSFPILGKQTLVEGQGPRAARVLLVDEEPDARRYCRQALRGEPVKCDESGTAKHATELLYAPANRFDLVLLCADLANRSALELLKQLRSNPPTSHLKVIITSNKATPEELQQYSSAGADDTIPKPFTVMQLRSRVRVALWLKEAQERADSLNRQIVQLNAEFEKAPAARDESLPQARNAVVLGLSRLVEQRSGESQTHLLRVQKYVRVLAETAARLPGFSSQIDSAFIDLLVAASPLHDVGKVALPDVILLKPGKLTPEERTTMQSHTIVGAEAIKDAMKQYPAATGFLQVAADIARHHHERYDGSGYPDKLVGSAIPLSARILALADVYDALRSRRVYKPAVSHNTSVLALTEGAPGHFDPGLLTAFRQCASQFEKIFAEIVD